MCLTLSVFSHSTRKPIKRCEIRLSTKWSAFFCNPVGFTSGRWLSGLLEASSYPARGSMMTKWLSGENNATLCLSFVAPRFYNWPLGRFLPPARLRDLEISIPTTAPWLPASTVYTGSSSQFFRFLSVFDAVEIETSLHVVLYFHCTKCGRETQTRLFSHNYVYSSWKRVT